MSQKKMTFEDALNRLEQVVSKLEQGETPLDESMALFEEGTGLVRTCSAALEQAQQRVTILMKNADGSVSEQMMEKNDERD